MNERQRMDALLTLKDNPPASNRSGMGFSQSAAEERIFATVHRTSAKTHATVERKFPKEEFTYAPELLNFSGVELHNQFSNCTTYPEYGKKPQTRHSATGQRLLKDAAGRKSFGPLRCRT
jgi:hypothetical protein